MKKIIDNKTLEESGLPLIQRQVIGVYLKELLTLYNLKTIENIGAIYWLESEKELFDYESYGMYEPISPNNIEFVDRIFLSNQNRQEAEYLLACFVLSADFAIYIISDKNILSADQLSIFNNAQITYEKIINLEEIKQ